MRFFVRKKVGTRILLLSKGEQKWTDSLRGKEAYLAVFPKYNAWNNMMMM